MFNYLFINYCFHFFLQIATEAEKSRTAELRVQHENHEAEQAGLQKIFRTETIKMVSQCFIIYNIHILRSFKNIQAFPVFTNRELNFKLLFFFATANSQSKINFHLFYRNYGRSLLQNSEIFP